MSADLVSLVAMPGQPDLDIDVDGLTVQRVHLDPNTRTITLRLADGFGRYYDTDGAAFVQPGDSTRIDSDWVVRMPDVTGTGWNEYTATLWRWWEQQTPVRLCAAPGRYTLLIEDRSTFLPFPRRTQTGDNHD